MHFRPTLAGLLAREHARGLADPLVAYDATKATIRALGERLPDNEAETFARALPPELVRLVEEAEYERDFDSAELIRRVARATDVSEAMASAHVAIVMRALGDVLDGATAEHLAHVLPEYVASCFAIRPHR